MTDKERYATIGTWVEVFREEGGAIGDHAIRLRLKKAELVGLSARNKVGCLIRNGFYSESDVREACFDLLNSFDPTYFQDADIVKADLAAFAAQLNERSSPIDLNSGNILSLYITCSNGRVMRGNAYLRHAAIALGFAVDVKGTSDKMAFTLKHLLKTAGFEIFDRDYFNNPGNLQIDLGAFVSQLGEDKTPFDLSSFNMASLLATCKNGRLMNGITYLNTAAMALGFSQSAREASPILVTTLKHLLKTAGFELFDRDYFENPNKLRADLTAFAARVGEDKTPVDLNTGNFSSLFVVCQNGQTLKGQAYLRTAARVLGFAKDDKDAASKMAYTLKHLLKTAGFGVKEHAPFDASYIRNPDNLRADLTAFAVQIGESQSVLDLNTNNICSLRITCQNGRVLRGQAYLCNAAKALGFAKGDKEAATMKVQTLRVLKEIAGLLIPSDD